MLQPLQTIHGGYSDCANASPKADQRLAILFVDSRLAAPLTELLELKTILEFLLVLFTVVTDALAFGALKFDEIILRRMIF